MISLRYYLDTRHGAEESPLKLCITRRGRCSYLTLDIRLRADQWDAARQQVVNHPRRKQLNSVLLMTRCETEEYLMPMLAKGELADLSVTQIKDLVKDRMLGKRCTTTLSEVWEGLEHRTANTAMSYKSSWNAILAYDHRAASMPIERITRKWVEDYSEWLSENYSGNTRNGYIAHLKHALSVAVEQDLIASNPASGTQTPYVETRKRNLNVEQIRKLLSSETVTEWERTALDFFRFSFLSRAANPADILTMTVDNIYNGRIEYDRHKTGKHYSVKIEPELQSIINDRGDGRSLFASGSSSCASFLARVNASLKDIALRNGLPEISMYWARHTLASLAYELGCSMDTVSQMLGHSYGARVTRGYVDASVREVDAANRKVLDYVFDDLDRAPVLRVTL